MSTVERYRRQHFAQAPILMRSNTFLTILEGMRQGAGVSLLPCGCESLAPELRRLTKPRRVADLWVLTHPELQQVPRMRAMLNALYDYLGARKDQFSGASPS